MGCSAGTTRDKSGNIQHTDAAKVPNTATIFLARNFSPNNRHSGMSRCGIPSSAVNPICPGLKPSCFIKRLKHSTNSPTDPGQLKKYHFRATDFSENLTMIIDIYFTFPSSAIESDMRVSEA
jgi:hypothetical protein